MFTVDGRRLGRPVRVTWGAGQLEGDAAVLLAVEQLVEQRASVSLVPVGPFARAAMAPAWVAHLTVLEVLDDQPRPITSGDVAELVPPGVDVGDDAYA